MFCPAAEYVSNLHTGLVKQAGGVLSHCEIGLPKKLIFFVLQHFFDQKCSPNIFFRRRNMIFELELVLRRRCYLATGKHNKTSNIAKI